MALVISQGRFFVAHTRLIRGTPRHQRGSTIEVEHPYRRSTAHLIRYWGEHTLIFGRWMPSDWDEDEALLAALEGTRRPDLDDDVVNWQRPG